MRSRMHSFWPAKAWQGSMQFQSPLQQHDVTQWWAPYHGMALYASIFTFLVFPLWCWLTMMHGTDTMPYASCMSLHNHSCRPWEAPAEPCPGDSRFERQILAWSWSRNSGFEAPIWAFGGELCPLIADLGTTSHKFLWEIPAPPGPWPSVGIWSL